MTKATKSPPAVRARKAGRVSDTLEHFAEVYRKENPQMDCRYVYDPEHKKDLSNVMARMAEGYRKVKVLDLGEGFNAEDLGMGDSDDIRVGDLVLMGIGKEEREALLAEKERLAKEQRELIDSQFQGAMASANEGLSQKHRARPIGSSMIEEREFSFDYTQKESE